MRRYLFSLFFFFNDTATTEIYTLSLHDALPICQAAADPRAGAGQGARGHRLLRLQPAHLDRKSTRLNSSHVEISYAVFCLKKKKVEIEIRFLTTAKIAHLVVPTVLKQVADSLDA